MEITGTHSVHDVVCTLNQRHDWFSVNTTSCNQWEQVTLVVSVYVTVMCTHRTLVIGRASASSCDLTWYRTLCTRPYHVLCDAPLRPLLVPRKVPHGCAVLRGMDYLHHLYRFLLHVPFIRRCTQHQCSGFAHDVYTMPLFYYSKRSYCLVFILITVLYSQHDVYILYSQHDVYILQLFIWSTLCSVHLNTSLYCTSLRCWWY